MSNQVHQDNASAILLEENGRKSAGEGMWALDIWNFVITDHVNEGDLEICHCLMDEMVTDCCTEPLQGKKFMEFHRKIMGFV